MRKDLIPTLNSKIDELKQILQNIKIEHILGSIANDLTLTPKDQDLNSKTGLVSPYRQYLYLYGLAVSSTQVKCEPLDKESWKQIKKLLQDIVMQYALIFYPSQEEHKSGLSEEWKKIREVSMEVFLNYFNVFELNYEEQVINRINKWFMPFSSLLKESVNCSADELLNIYKFIHDCLQNTFDEISESFKIEEKIRHEFIDKYFTKDKTIEEIRKIAQSHPVKDAVIGLLKKLNEAHRIRIKNLYVDFDKKTVDSFISIFSIKRQKRDFRFFTEVNPVIDSPLFSIDKDTLFCVCHKLVLFSIFKFIYTTLENSSAREKFYKHRDSEAERQTLELFKSLFKEKGEYYSSLYETPKAEFEHDCLIKYGKDIFLIEVKAGKVKEPFRDPDKAFIRISRDFNDESGIQNAYNQALHLKNAIISKEETLLYNEKGDLIFRLDRKDINNIFIICVTAEPYGIIASNLSLLLHKPETEPYPWCCNLYDLDTFINGINSLKLAAENFIYYLVKRSELHGKLIASDELEIAGYFLMYKTFKHIEEKTFDYMRFTPDMANIFDKIYFESKGIPYSLEMDEKPAMVNPREEMRKMLIKDSSKAPKVGRNDPCLCGSGRKYKKCCEQK